MLGDCLELVSSKLISEFCVTSLSPLSTLSSLVTTTGVDGGTGAAADVEPLLGVTAPEADAEVPPALISAANSAGKL